MEDEKVIDEKVIDDDDDELTLLDHFVNSSIIFNFYFTSSFLLFRYISPKLELNKIEESLIILTSSLIVRKICRKI